MVPIDTEILEGKLSAVCRRIETLHTTRKTDYTDPIHDVINYINLSVLRKFESVKTEDELWDMDPSRNGYLIDRDGDLFHWKHGQLIEESTGEEVGFEVTAKYLPAIIHYNNSED